MSRLTVIPAPPQAVGLVVVLTANGLRAAAAEEEPAAAAEKEMVLDPATGKMVTAPEYGGTLTISKSGIFPPTADPYFSTSWALHSLLHGVLESLSIGNWAIDRDEFDWSSYGDPLFGKRGALAESWEISEDGLTYTIHIRPGVHFHDKPPVNGREMTAELLAATYYREIGVDIEIEPVPGPELTPRKKARDWDMMHAIMADKGSWLPWNAMAQYKTGATGKVANVNDPAYDAMLAAAAKVSTEEEQLLLVKELNMYAIERHWTAFAGTVIPWTSVIQPWVKGYNGELKLASREFEYTIAARLWIDQELKESMGF